MRGQPSWVTTGKAAVAAAVVTLVALPSVAGAAAATNPDGETVLVVDETGMVVDETVTTVELAPGESPGGISEGSGPVLTFPTPPTSITPDTEMAPAGPTLADPALISPPGVDLDSTTLLVVAVTALPSLSVGVALWLIRNTTRRPHGIP